MIPAPRFSPRSCEKLKKRSADFFLHLSLLCPHSFLYLALMLEFRLLEVTVCMCFVGRNDHTNGLARHHARQRQISASLTVFGQEPLRGAPRIARSRPPLSSRHAEWSALSNSKVRRPPMRYSSPTRVLPRPSHPIVCFGSSHFGSDAAYVPSRPEPAPSSSAQVAPGSVHVVHRRRGARGTSAPQTRARRRPPRRLDPR